MAGKPKQSLHLQTLLFIDKKIILTSPYGFIFKTLMFKLCDNASYTVTPQPLQDQQMSQLQQTAEKAWLTVRWEGAAVIVFGVQ